MIVTIAKLYACWWWLTGGQACWLLLQSYSLDNWPPFAESPISTPWAQSGTFSAITWMHTNTESSNIEQKFPTHLFCHCHWSTQRAEESLVKYHCVDTGDRRVSVIKATSNWKSKMVETTGSFSTIMLELAAVQWKLWWSKEEQTKESAPPRTSGWNLVGFSEYFSKGARLMVMMVIAVMLIMVRLLVRSNKALQSRDELSWLAALSRGGRRGGESTWDLSLWQTTSHRWFPFSISTTWVQIIQAKPLPLASFLSSPILFSGTPPLPSLRDT